ncbi:hypothetical protein [Vibrio sp. CAU 1672]|uniref:hypothetical protein n=1 Tax=Vibrio sp. CAU 1672 TaxID=3032594 RepID=UPI0023DA4A1D|nr:hypothetical protein [Vibrio sp. CAU 1672]MDF2153835.1 hypothetical protein [Vibrio sp. CAU 1672]
MSEEQLNELADRGCITEPGTQQTYYLYKDGGIDEKQILTAPSSKSLCSGQPQSQPYAPQGARGWLDEYCEWSITYDKQGKMKRIVFTCENPAYYFTLWQVSPEAVLKLYQCYVDPAVKLEDLYLRSKDGQRVVVDPTTGRPAYNPTNKWNSGTMHVAGQCGGAMHLKSPPNTLSAEIELGAAATTLRQCGNTDEETLLCCGQFGQPYRNSDPHIGQAVNTITQYLPSLSGGAANVATLANPVGLYLQQPSLDDWKGPNGEDLCEYWVVERGLVTSERSYILQASFEIPASAGFGIEDCRINQDRITHASVIARYLSVGLYLQPMFNSSARQDEAYRCVVSRPDPQAKPDLLQPFTLFEAESVSDLPCSLIRGQTNCYALTVSDLEEGIQASDISVRFDVEGIEAVVDDIRKVERILSGGTELESIDVVYLTVTTSVQAPVGLVKLALSAAQCTQPLLWAHGMAIVLE